MFAHGSLELPENLLPDDVSDLLAGLGYVIDRRNVCRALEASDIPGVVPPPSRASRWTIPRDVIVDVVAAVLLRRAMRTAAPGRWRVGELAGYRLPAARLLMQQKSFGKFVPAALQRQVKAEIRARRAAAAERQRQRMAAIEQERRAELRAQAQDEKRRNHAATTALYFECRSNAAMQVTAGRGGNTPEYAAFLRDWPAPDFATGWPDWWRPPPGLLPKVRERTDAWIEGRTSGYPNISDLVPADIDYTKPWPWRVEPADA